jgi:hypothetical protein
MKRNSLCKKRISKSGCVKWVDNRKNDVDAWKTEE